MVCSDTSECMSCARGFKPVAESEYEDESRCPNSTVRTYLCHLHLIDDADDSKCTSDGNDCYVVGSEPQTCEAKYRIVVIEPQVGNCVQYTCVLDDGDGPGGGSGPGGGKAPGGGDGAPTAPGTDTPDSTTPGGGGGSGPGGGAAPGGGDGVPTAPGIDTPGNTAPGGGGGER